jgi:hypothetical protein
MPAVEANSTKRKQARIGADVEQTLHPGGLQAREEALSRRLCETDRVDLHGACALNKVSCPF